MYKSNTTYFDWLHASASPQVKRELMEMEKSRVNSFASVRTVLKEKYGQRKNNCA